MSATQHKAFTLVCDQRDCRSQLGPVIASLAETRKKAARRGWFTERASSRRDDKDYCPEHKPGATGGTE